MPMVAAACTTSNPGNRGVARQFLLDGRRVAHEDNRNPVFPCRRTAPATVAGRAVASHSIQRDGFQKAGSFPHDGPTVRPRCTRSRSPLHNLLPVVMTAVRAGLMLHLQRPALRAGHQRGRLEVPVGASLVPPRRGMSSFRQCHRYPPCCWRLPDLLRTPSPEKTGQLTRVEPLKTLVVLRPLPQTFRDSALTHGPVLRRVILSTSKTGSCPCPAGSHTRLRSSSYRIADKCLYNPDGTGRTSARSSPPAGAPVPSRPTRNPQYSRRSGSSLSIVPTSGPAAFGSELLLHLDVERYPRARRDTARRSSRPQRGASRAPSAADPTF